MKAKYLIIFAVLSVVTARAEKESGGEPETAFDFDRSALTTILQNEEVISRLRFKGRVLGIAPVSGRDGVFSVSTEQCSLHVQFTRNCEFPPGQLPQCDYNAKVLLHESKGNCAQ